MMQSTQLLDVVLLTTHAMVVGWISSAILGITVIVVGILFDRREYVNSMASDVSYKAVQDRIDKTSWYSWSRVANKGTMVAVGPIVGRWFSFFVTTESQESRNERLVVWRWRWLAPIVPDTEIVTKQNKIKVTRSIGHEDWRSFNEIACPPFVPQNVKDACEKSALDILTAATEDFDQGRVILSGPPGSGKSTTARVLVSTIASKLGQNAVLVVGFDPTRQGHNMASILEQALFMVDDRWVVVVIEEVDCVLKRVVEEKLVTTSGVGELGLPEVIDKASWNCMLDMLYFRPRVLLIMTTNLTFEELDRIDDTGAMLRPGRITSRIIMDHHVIGKGVSPLPKRSENNNESKVCGKEKTM